MSAHDRTLMTAGLPAPAPLPSLTTAFSRRRAIFGGLAVAAVPVSALAAPSVSTKDNAQPSPLAAALQAEFQQLAYEEEIATDKFDATYEVLDHPDAPEELFVRQGDMATLRWHTGDVEYKTKRRWWGEDTRIERLRNYDYGQYESYLNRKAAARRDEIVAAWDNWEAAKRTAEDRCGYTAAHAAWLAASDRYEAFRLRLIHLQTTDREVMRLKATVVTKRYAGTAGLGNAIQRNLDNEDDLEALCFSIVRDFALHSGSDVA